MAGRAAPGAQAHASDQVVLAVEGLETRFFSRDGTTPAVENMSLTLRRGETLGLVGESGCGKSVTALSILRLIPPRSGQIAAGTIRYDGRDLLALDERAMQCVRGNDISMIFQEPMTALNPVFTIGFQIIEALSMHQTLDRAAAYERAIEMLRLVRIPEPERRLEAYPHQLSGGMRQRAMIAMALCCNPKVLIADEPTTALDVTIQAQILDLMAELQERLGTAIIMITHDLGVVAETARRVIVMYAGRKVEEADVEALFDSPRHPYTQGLLKAAPRLGGADAASRRRLHAIEGTVPSLRELPPGCRFAPRCPAATAQCGQATPPLEEKALGHWAACWNSPSELLDARRGYG